MPDIPRFGTVSFRETTKAGPFYEQIWSGRKRLTMREPMIDGRPHVKPGHAFTMYWRVRVSRRKKPVHYIGLALCEEYRLMDLADVWDDEEHAKRDGFMDLAEFQKHWGYPEGRLYVIGWAYPLLDWGEMPRPLA